MKTILQRAREGNPYRDSEYTSFDEYNSGCAIGWDNGYFQGATDQKELDNEEVQEAKGAYYDAGYETGVKRTIEKACEWARQQNFSMSVQIDLKKFLEEHDDI